MSLLLLPVPSLYSLVQLRLLAQALFHNAEVDITTKQLDAMRNPMVVLTIKPKHCLQAVQKNLIGGKDKAFDPLEIGATKKVALG